MINHELYVKIIDYPHDLGMLRCTCGWEEVSFTLFTSHEAWSRHLEEKVYNEESRPD